jgi:hypothetical protein
MHDHIRCHLMVGAGFDFIGRPKNGACVLFVCLFLKSTISSQEEGKHGLAHPWWPFTYPAALDTQFWQGCFFIPSFGSPLKQRYRCLGGPVHPLGVPMRAPLTCKLTRTRAS